MDGPSAAEDVMTTTRKSTRKSTSRTFTLVGAGIGLAAFLAVGLLPSILYGGCAGVMLAGGIFGTPVDASFAVRAFIVGGMVIGVAAAGSLFAVVGAAAGAAVAALTRSRKVEAGAEAGAPVAPKR
jgi:hypothetical protein